MELNKITESQYLEALEIIQSYRDQINNQCEGVLNESITVEKFLEKHGHEMSRRLFNSLNGKWSYRYDAENIHNEWKRSTFLSNIKYYDVIKLMYFGKKCAIEFESLGKQYGVDLNIR